MADPEVYKQVEVTKQLATLFGVAKTDQVLVWLLTMMNAKCNFTSQCLHASAQPL